MNLPLRIAARGMCCAVGHNAPAATAALRARMNHFQETEFTDESGMPLIGATLHDVPFWGEHRQQLMFEQVLRECVGALPDVSQPLPIILICTEHARGQYYQDWALRLLQHAEGITGYHPYSRAAPLGKAGIAKAIEATRAIFRTSQPPEYVIIVGVDSYFDAQTIEPLLAQERLKTTANADGMIPGEGACALALSWRQVAHPALWIDGIGESSEHATPTGEEPLLAKGLTQAIRAALRDAGCALSDLQFQATGASGESWYFKEAALALSRALDKRVHDFPHLTITQYAGEVGAASAPLTLAWLASEMHRNPDLGKGALLHFSNDDGRRAALIIRHRL